MARVCSFANIALIIVAMNLLMIHLITLRRKNPLNSSHNVQLFYLFLMGVPRCFLKVDFHISSLIYKAYISSPANLSSVRLKRSS